MNQIFTLLLFLPFALILSAGDEVDAQIETSNKTPKVVFIIVDGISIDTIREVETPAIDSISQEGGFAEAIVGGEKGGYSQSPTISAVGYNSLLTGTWANKHNVWGNSINAPNYHYWNVFRLTNQTAPEKKTAIFSTWLDNRTKLIGDGKEVAGDPRLDYHFDGFEHDKINFPHTGKSAHIRAIDQHVAQEAARYVKEHGPDLSWVYLQYTDDMGHRYGDSPDFYQSIKEADQYVQGIWDSIQDRMKTENEEWMIIVTTDHGRDEQTGKSHGGQSARERSIWISTNFSDLNPHFNSDTAEIVDIFPTIARFMDIEIPLETLRELDGVPLIGPVSVSDLQATYNTKTRSIDLSWKTYDCEGSAQIYLSKTNNFKDGGEDEYELVKSVPVRSGKSSIQADPSPFYKIVFEAPHNTLNRWIVNE